MAPTREEAGEKRRLMLLPRRHWLPSAGNNAVLFSPGSCSDQQNGPALLHSAWRQCPILSYQGKANPLLMSSALLTYPAPPTTLHRCPFTFTLSLLFILLATFPQLSGPRLKSLTFSAPVTESSLTPQASDESRTICGQSSQVVGGRALVTHRAARFYSPIAAKLQST